MGNILTLDCKLLTAGQAHALFDLPVNSMALGHSHCSINICGMNTRGSISVLPTLRAVREHRDESGLS